MEIERRYVSASDLEVRADDDSFMTRGHAATFNEPYDLGPFDEQIDPSAFDRSMKESDVRALWNHDSSVVLGRTKSGTLRLAKDDVGLLSEIDFPVSATAQREAIERGDVDQMSFGFRALKDQWEEFEDGRELRTILEAELFDVSPVAFPANPNTDLSVAKRSRDEWRDLATMTTDDGKEEPDEERESAQDDDVDAEVLDEERTRTLQIHETTL